jgi:hypothetical protein
VAAVVRASAHGLPRLSLGLSVIRVEPYRPCGPSISYFNHSNSSTRKKVRKHRMIPVVSDASRITERNREVDFVYNRCHDSAMRSPAVLNPSPQPSAWPSTAECEQPLGQMSMKNKGFLTE